MQVLCKISDSASDVHCEICGQGFRVFWSRTAREEQQEALNKVRKALAAHHTGSTQANSHPSTSFNVPEWSGLPQFSGAAILSGSEIHTL
jgi:hypothetical protein